MEILPDGERFSFLFQLYARLSEVTLQPFNTTALMITYLSLEMLQSMTVFLLVLTIMKGRWMMELGGGGLFACCSVCLFLWTRFLKAICWKTRSKKDQSVYCHVHNENSSAQSVVKFLLCHLTHSNGKNVGVCKSKILNIHKDLTKIRTLNQAGWRCLQRSDSFHRISSFDYRCIMVEIGSSIRYDFITRIGY